MPSCSVPGRTSVRRRWRRLTLGWVVIPTLAVLTAGGIAVAGDGMFSEGDPAAAVFVQTTPGGAYELATALTYSSDGGVARQVLPVGWSVMTGGNMFGPTDMSSTVLEPTADGRLTSSVRLEAMQANVRSYEGPAPDLDLQVTAEYTPDGEGGGTIIAARSPIAPATTSSTSPCSWATPIARSAHWPTATPPSGRPRTANPRVRLSESRERRCGPAVGQHGQPHRPRVG